jgi:hypothetical protein
MRSQAAGCYQGRHHHLGNPVLGTPGRCEGPGELAGQDGHRRDKRIGVPVEDLDGLPSSAVIAKAFPSAKFVKGLNHLAADGRWSGADAGPVSRGFLNARIGG